MKYLESPIFYMGNKYKLLKQLNRNYNPFSRGNSNNDEVYICNYKISLEG